MQINAGSSWKCQGRYEREKERKRERERQTDRKIENEKERKKERKGGRKSSGTTTDPFPEYFYTVKMLGHDLTTPQLAEFVKRRSF